MIKEDIWEIILLYLDEQTDGEFLRYYQLNPACKGPLLDDIEDYIMEEIV